MSKIHMREKLIEKSVTPSGAPTSLKLGPNNWYICHHKLKFSWHSKQNHLYFKLLKKKLLNISPLIFKITTQALFYAQLLNGRSNCLALQVFFCNFCVSKVDNFQHNFNVKWQSFFCQQKTTASNQNQTLVYTGLRSYCEILV